MLKVGGFLYLFLSLLGGAALDWYHMSMAPTAFWQIPVAMIAVILWFFGAIIANEMF